MTRGAVVGLIFLVIMLLDWWWRPFLDRQPRPRPDPPPTQRVRGELTRPGRELERR